MSYAIVTVGEPIQLIEGRWGAPVALGGSEPRQPEQIIALVGPPGPEGGDGAGSGYEHAQLSAETLWTVNHNLGRQPVVSVLTPGGAEIVAEVNHVSLNQLQVQLASAATGKVIAR